MTKEYPKCLFRDGNASGENIEVNNQEEENDAKADGFMPAKSADEDANGGTKRKAAKKGYSTAVISDVSTEFAAEKPEDGYVYSTTGSAPTPGHFNQKAAGNVTTKPVNQMLHGEPIEKKIK